MTKFIVVDVDATVVDTSFCWFKYLECLTKNKYRYMQELPYNSEGFIEYNLAKYYPELTEDEAFSFWHNPTLYDNMKPIPEVVEALAGIVGDVKVVFCSMCRPEHLKSKENFIDREIGQFLQVPYGFVDTADKDSLKADVFIDDRHNFLNMSDTGAVKIKINTPYTQDEELKVPVIAVDTWVEIKGIFKALGYIGEV